MGSKGVFVGRIRFRFVIRVGRIKGVGFGGKVEGEDRVGG